MLEVYTNFALKVDFVNGKSFYPVAPEHMEHCLKDEIFSSYVMRMRRDLWVTNSDLKVDEGVNVYLANKARPFNEREHDDTFGIIIEKWNSEHLITKQNMPAVVFHYGQKNLLMTSTNMNGLSIFAQEPKNIESYYLDSLSQSVPVGEAVYYQQQKNDLRMKSFKNMECILEKHPYKEPLLIDLHQMNKGKDVLRKISYN